MCIILPHVVAPKKERNKGKKQEESKGEETTNKK
jgi:hypothetical protein